MHKIALSIGLLLLPASAAIAQESFYQRHLAPPCYARSYDEQHLAAHPQQRVSSFHVVSAGYEDTETESFIVSFGFTVKGDGDLYYSSASCDSIPDAAQCWADGDAGTFTLEAIDGGLEVRVGANLTLEGNTGFSPDIGQGGDDKVIRLGLSPSAACLQR